MASELFVHPISGQHQGSTCVCGLYRVGGGTELCDDCRGSYELKAQVTKVAELEAQVAELKAEVSQLRMDKISLADKLQTVSDNSTRMFKAMLVEMSDAKSEAVESRDHIDYLEHRRRSRK